MNAPMNFAPRLLAAAALLLYAAPVSRAQVNASISSQTGQVGVPLQLQYQFVNVGRPADMPRSARLFVPHPRIAAAARAGGWLTVLSTAGDAGLMTALQTWFDGSDHE